MWELSKSFRFDAAHTLERAVETESSRRIHGHSYLAEVTVGGRPDPATGMIMDLALLRQALERAQGELDHRLLDEVPGLGPATLENLAAWIWEKLHPLCPALERVTVRRESSGDACTYFGSSRAP